MLKLEFDIKSDFDIKSVYFVLFHAHSYHKWLNEWMASKDKHFFIT